MRKYCHSILFYYFEKCKVDFKTVTFIDFSVRIKCELIMKDNLKCKF